MHQIGIYIKKIHTQLERCRNCHYREYNLTSTQLDLIEYLYFHSGQQNSLSDIASFFGVQHTSVIHVLKVLEKKGFIRKGDCKQGSRCKPILLTEKGRDIIQAHHCCPSDIDAALFYNIPQEHLQILEQSLRQMYENLMHDPVLWPDSPSAGNMPDSAGNLNQTVKNQKENQITSDKNQKSVQKGVSQ